MSSHRHDIVAVFDALPQAARDAREFTTHVLDRWKLSYLSETASLLVSELITNSITHAGGIVEPAGELAELRGEIPCVMLGLTVRDALLVEVCDGSGTPPTRRTAGDDQEDGRGLALVEALSKEWGYKILATGGKITWFALDLEGP